MKTRSVGLHLNQWFKTQNWQLSHTWSVWTVPDSKALFSKLIQKQNFIENIILWTDYIILFCFVNRLYYCCVNCIGNEKKKFRFASELVVQNSKLAAKPHVKNVWTVPDSKSPIFKTDSEAEFIENFILWRWPQSQPIKQ